LTKLLSYIALIIFFISSNSLTSDEKDVSIYGSIFSTPGVFELNLEYNFLSFDMFGIESTTIARVGNSMFGIQGLSVRYSTPVVGLVQYFGNDSGFDLGLSYLSHYNNVTIFFNDHRRNDPVRIDQDSERLIRIDGGYRNYFSENGIFRFSIVSFADFDKIRNNGNWDFDFILSASVGYSF